MTLLIGEQPCRYPCRFLQLTHDIGQKLTLVIDQSADQVDSPFDTDFQRYTTTVTR
jgi:hypothetical protein